MANQQQPPYDGTPGPSRAARDAAQELQPPPHPAHARLPPTTRPRRG